MKRKFFVFALATAAYALLGLLIRYDSTGVQALAMLGAIVGGIIGTIAGRRLKP